jgi:hypothetical protein
VVSKNIHGEHAHGKLRMVALALGAILLGSSPAVIAGDIWYFPEYYRIDPRDGAVAEFGFRPVSDAFKSSNDVYLRRSNTVTLVAMKAETIRGSELSP